MNPFYNEQLYNEQRLSRLQIITIVALVGVGLAIMASQALLWIFVGAVNTLEEHTYFAGMATGGTLALTAICYEKWLRNKLFVIWLELPIATLILGVVWYPVIMEIAQEWPTVIIMSATLLICMLLGLVSNQTDKCFTAPWNKNQAEAMEFQYQARAWHNVCKQPVSSSAQLIATGILGSFFYIFASDWLALAVVLLLLSALLLLRK